MERLPAHRGNTSPDWCLMLMRHIRKKSLITAFSPGSLSCCLEMSSSGQSSLVSQSPSLGRKKKRALIHPVIQNHFGSNSLEFVFGCLIRLFYKSLTRQYPPPLLFVYIYESVSVCVEENVH